ncbi:hypothetical protein KDW41_29380, partial [Burkholderia vietnamiensis]|nr:hypothetical protein [Burkholderia vietnamiensis]
EPYRNIPWKIVEYAKMHRIVRCNHGSVTLIFVCLRKNRGGVEQLRNPTPEFVVVNGVGAWIA